MGCRDCDPLHVCDECGQYKPRNRHVPLELQPGGGMLPHPECRAPHKAPMSMRWLGQDFRLYGVGPNGWVTDLERLQDEIVFRGPDRTKL